MAQKFIINDGILFVGDVVLHKELCKNRDANKTSGGGYWHIDRSTRTIYFYGSSFDFGQVTQEQFDAAIKSEFIERMNIVFTTEEMIIKS